MKLNERVCYRHETNDCGYLIDGTIAFDHKDTFLIAFEKENIPLSFSPFTHSSSSFDSWTARPEGFTEMFSNFPNCKFKWIHKKSKDLWSIEIPIEDLIYNLEKEVI